MIPSMLYKYLPICLVNNHKIMLVGDPGIGKTSVIRGVAKNIKKRLIEIHLSSYVSGDVRGFLMVIDGIPQFVPIGSIGEVLSSDEPTILLLDDLLHAQDSVLKPAMQLIRGRLGDFVVPDNVSIIAATNDKGKNGVKGCFEPLKSSFHGIIQAEVSTTDCNQYAVDNNWRIDLRSFLAFHTEYWHKPEPTTDLINSPCPRQNDHLNDLLNDCDQIEYSSESERKKVMRENVQGACGEEYMEAWIQHHLVLAKCPSPAAILEDPTGTILPDFYSEQSALFATVCAVANMMDNESFSDSIHVDNLWRFADRIPAPFQRHLIHEVMEINEHATRHSWCIQHEIENSKRDWTF